MLNASDAHTLQRAYGVKYRDTIEQAEAIVSERPKWLDKKLAKIERDIKAAVASGENRVFYFVGWILAWSFTKRLAIAIALAKEGYYVSCDSSMFISWFLDSGGIIKVGESLEYKNGRWNVELRDISGFYKVLTKKENRNA